MSLFSSPRFLPRVLMLDAVTCAGAGLLQIFGGEWLSQLLQLPSVLLLESGLFLVAFAAALAWLATRPEPSRKGIAFIAAGNMAWAVACVALMAGPWVGPSTLGMVWIGIQAGASVLMADLQWLGLRGSRGQGRMALAS